MWLYSVGLIVFWLPAVMRVFIYPRPTFDPLQGAAWLATAFSHLGDALTLRAGYRASDLSLLYPIARGSGPLLSFVAAVALLGEPLTAQSICGVRLMVAAVVSLAPA
jgi:multidrug transporter EmrE-like cation transporter